MLDAGPGLGPDGEAGIYFWSLEASSLLAVVGARLVYGLPYFPARMSMRRAGARVEYTSRRWLGQPAELRLGWTVAEAIGAARPGTLDHFLIERYALYAPRMRGLFPRRVRHPLYPLHRASIDHLSETLRGGGGHRRADGARHRLTSRRASTSTSSRWSVSEPAHEGTPASESTSRRSGPAGRRPGARLFGRGDIDEPAEVLARNAGEAAPQGPARRRGAALDPIDEMASVVAGEARSASAAT